VCRHVAYLGVPRTLSSLLLDPPHSLVDQSWAPRCMRGTATMNADGFGIGWYASEIAPPARYRRAVPIWTDASFPGLAAATVSGAVLASVRSATPGLPVTEGAAAPFGDGRWLFSHNGYVTGWPDSMSGVAGALPVRALLTLEAPTDSALLWALVRAELELGIALDAALATVVSAVADAAPGSRLNLLVTDGRQIAATTWGNSLFVRPDAHGVTVASEPDSDDPQWTEVPESSLVLASLAGITTTALPSTRTQHR
jgi:glutamine amidotransferase